MSHVITHSRSPAARAAAVFAIFAALAALSVTVNLSSPTQRDLGSAAVASPGVGYEVPVALTLAVPAPSTSVPDASSVFAGRDAPVEETVPNF